MKSKQLFPALLLAVFGLAGAGAASAQTTWDWRGSPPAGCDPATCTVNNVTATVSAYGAETSTGWMQSAVVRDLDPNLGQGLGVKSNNENTNSPNHAIDNFRWNSTSWSAGTTYGGADYAELLAIHFSEAVKLTQVAVSWTGLDSDAMIFRWDGGVAAPNLLTTVPSVMPTALGVGGTGTASGWTLVAAGQFHTSGNKLDIVGDIYSSYWLVSTALGQTGTGTSSSPGNLHNDAFKVSTFTGHIKPPPTPPDSGQGGAVPEPSTLALAGVAMLGLIGRRGRRRACPAA